MLRCIPCCFDDAAVVVNVAFFAFVAGCLFVFSAYVQFESCQTFFYSEKSAKDFFLNKK